MPTSPAARRTRTPVQPRPRGKGARGLPKLDVRPDAMDFRDLMYVPTLVEVPTHVPLEDYLAHGVPVLDQGSEGACTGYGLATVANYLLRRRRVSPDPQPVSPRMLYKLARRYDEWPGEDYSGSSARGAMKGWHKHGVCAESLWARPRQDGVGLDARRAADACRRPLGAYFRVNHKDLVAMHSAIAEVGVLFASAMVHSGWDEVGEDGVVAQRPTVLGGHAFAIVGFDEHGFWLQNSWGEDWGRRGFGRISYDDWLANGSDVWVARLGAPVLLSRPETTAQAHARAAGRSASYSHAELRPHIVSIGNDGRLRAGGDYGSTPEELARVFEREIPAALRRFDAPRILLHAHGGLVGEQSAVQRLAEYRASLLPSGVYPLAFVWRTDYWTTLGNILQDAVRRRRPEGALDAAKDFMLDRLDDALEPLARVLTGKSTWDEMKENALLASRGEGAALRVADHLQALARRFPKLEVHLVGHSAGSILLAPLVKLLVDRGLRLPTATLWAPACTVDMFRQHWLPAIRRKAIERFALFALRDDVERDDDCAKIYHKSLLYLVSNAFEARARIPLFRDGVPILGMEKFLGRELRDELSALGAEIVLSPNGQPLGSPVAAEAMHHGDFDDDARTVAATFGRILAATRVGGTRGAAGAAPLDATHFHRSGSAMRERRQAIDACTRPRSSSGG